MVFKEDFLRTMRLFYQFYINFQYDNGHPCLKTGSKLDKSFGNQSLLLK